MQSVWGLNCSDALLTGHFNEKILKPKVFNFTTLTRFGAFNMVKKMLKQPRVSQNILQVEMRKVQSKSSSLFSHLPVGDVCPKSVWLMFNQPQAIEEALTHLHQAWNQSSIKIWYWFNVFQRMRTTAYEVFRHHICPEPHASMFSTTSVRNVETPAELVFFYALNRIQICF